MAGWDDLMSFVRVRYEIMRQRENELWFNLPTTGERTQIVVVRLVTGEDGHPWAQITSPVGRIGQVDLVKLLELAAEPVTGGVVSENGLVLFRHSIPLRRPSWATPSSTASTARSSSSSAWPIAWSSS